MLFKEIFITEASTKVDFHHGTYCDVKTYKREYTFKCANIKYGAIWEAISNLKDMTNYQYETEM